MQFILFTIFLLCPPRHDCALFLFQSQHPARLHCLLNRPFRFTLVYLSSLQFCLIASLLFHITSRSIHAAFLWESWHFFENVTSCHFAISGGATQLIYLHYSAIRLLERPALGLKSVQGIRKQRLAAGIPVVNVSIGPSQKSISRTVGTRDRAHGDLVINHNGHTNINRARLPGDIDKSMAPNMLLRSPRRNLSFQETSCHHKTFLGEAGLGGTQCDDTKPCSVHYNRPILKDTKSLQCTWTHW